MRSTNGRWLATAFCTVALLGAAGCPGDPDEPDTPQTAERAGEDVIARAGSAEERQALEEAREEIAAEAREAARELDAEIERLSRENAALKARLAR